jgi:sterol desaturase/sphingolipid hydroxylase (fatty acid hydroxylase superfamily)
MRDYINLLGLVLLLSLVFYPFELLAPAEKGQPFAKRLLNLAYMPVFLALALFVLAPVVNPIASGVLRISGKGLLPNWSNHPSFVVQFLFAIAFALCWDFLQYWLHRWQHKSSWLWQTHKFHHSDTALNATTQSRHHLLHLFLSTIFYLPVLVVFSTQVPHSVALFLMFRLWGFVNHANLRLDIGPLTPVISGPHWHRIHHSILPEHRDKNFATFFPFIDRIFGTYYRPRKNEYPPSGLHDGETSSPVREATLAPFFAWFRDGLTLMKRIVPVRNFQTAIAPRNICLSESADAYARSIAEQTPNTTSSSMCDQMGKLRTVPASNSVFRRGAVVDVNER